MSTFIAAATSGITNNPDDPEYIARLVGGTMNWGQNYFDKSF